MLTGKSADFVKGWMIGDFEPSIIKTSSFEFAHHFYRRGFIGEPHIHKIATEINYIVDGGVLIDKELFYDGDYWIFAPGEYKKVEFTKDTNLIIIKIPSVPDDKYGLTAELKHE